MTNCRTRTLWVTADECSEDFVQQIVSLHAAVLPDDLTAMLGLQVRIYIFSRLIDEEDCIVAMDGNKIVGFCIFSKRSTLRNAFLAVPFSLCWSLLRLAIRSPAHFLEFLHVILQSALSRGEELKYSTEIFSFGVSMDKQSQGIGSGIIRLASERYRSPGILTKTSDPRAAQFYLNNGFHLVAEERRGNRAFKVLLSNSSGSVPFNE